jgi:hypothetical protein
MNSEGAVTVNPMTSALDTYAYQSSSLEIECLKQIHSITGATKFNADYQSHTTQELVENVNGRHNVEDSDRTRSVADGEDEDEEEMDDDDRAQDDEITKLTQTIFENPLALINLDADIDEFLAAKRISDVTINMYLYMNVHH